MSRKLHRICAWITAIPFLIILTTGTVLQVKTWIPWIQPPVQKGNGIQLGLPIGTFLDVARSIPNAQVKDWKDIRSIDIRPSHGAARLRTRSNLEVTIDLESGKVLQVAPRRTNLLIELHEGSFFGDGIKYGIYFPSALALLVLSGTGIVLLLRKVAKKFQINRGYSSW